MPTLVLVLILVSVVHHGSVAGYCSLNKPGYTARVKYIREGFEKRVSNSELLPHSVQRGYRMYLDLISPCTSDYKPLHLPPTAIIIVKLQAKSLD